MQDIMATTWVGATASRSPGRVRRGDRRRPGGRRPPRHTARADRSWPRSARCAAARRSPRRRRSTSRRTWPTCRWPGCRWRSRRTPRSPACRPGTGRRPPAPTSPRPTTSWYGGCAAPGAVVLGVTRMPELGLWALTDDDERGDPQPVGAATAPPVGPPAAPPPRSRPGWCRSRTPTTVSARSASRRPAAAWSGSSPAGAWCPCELGADDWFGLAEHGMLATTVADAAVGFAVLAGRRPQKLIPAAAGCGSRSRCARRCAASRRTRPTGTRSPPPRGCWPPPGTTRCGRSGLPDRARPAGHRHLVRRGLPRRPRPPGWTAWRCSRAPAGTSRWASGPGGAGYVREADRAACPRPVGRLLRRPRGRPAAHPGAGRRRRRQAAGWSAGPGWPT